MGFQDNAKLKKRESDGVRPHIERQVEPFLSVALQHKVSFHFVVSWLAWVASIVEEKDIRVWRLRGNHGGILRHDASATFSKMREKSLK